MMKGEVMKKWKHINFEQRKTIVSGITHNKKLCEIATILNLDPTSISKEVKRNRILSKYGRTSQECPLLTRWPYVCTNCNKKYTSCHLNQYRYDSKVAQNNADCNLINSRKGIDISSEEFKQLDSIIKNGVDNHKSIYQIKIEHSDKVTKSLTTLYRYIDKGYLTTKKIDLPFAVTYKKRKYKSKYNYSDNTIDRSNHTYLDYLAYIHNHPNSYVWQLDFLGSIKKDSKSILTLSLPNLQFSIIEIIDLPNSSKVVSFFDYIENKIGTDAFLDLFPAILTDRDPCFNDSDGICFSKNTGEERCKLFYCDPYVSNQKPNVENINKQLRKFFPKGKSIDIYTPKDIKEKNFTLLDTPLKSLDSFTPKQAFIKVFSEELFNNLLK